jgi:hypothetical protein
MGTDPVYGRSSVTITGYACACPTPDAPTRPSRRVVDPFRGYGHDRAVRVGAGPDRDQRRPVPRITAGSLSGAPQDPAQRAKAMRVEKPPVELDGQEDLFGGEAA